jgi:hypothetical protein
MSTGMHIHVVDGKQVQYSNNACPICGTAPLPEAERKKVPNVHRKGNTIVLQVTRLQMATITWYSKESVFLMSLRKASKSSDGKVIRDNQGRPVWTQITMRVNVPLMKNLITEIGKMVKEVETTPTYTNPTVPQRG